MCWSGEASFALATLGFSGAAFAAHRKEPVGRWAPLIYFALMETLQGFTYGWIGECGNPTNELLTVLSYIHICFQPFFVNMFYLSFGSQGERKKAGWIWWACVASSVAMLTMYALPDWPAGCDPVSQSICGAMTCAYHGNWHIAWMLELSNLDPHWASYWLVAFVLPLLYGSWRVVAYHLICGPFLAYLLTTNKDEHPAIWCLLSIAFLLATHVPVLKRQLLSKKARAEHS